MDKITILYIIIAILAIICLVLFFMWYSVYTKPDKKIASTNAIIKQKTNNGYEAISVGFNCQENSWFIRTTSILNIGDPIELIAVKK